VWTVDVLDADQVLRQADDRKAQAKEVERRRELGTDKQRVLDTMAKLGRETRNVIRDTVGLGRGQRFDQAWAALLADKQIVEHGTIRKDNHQDYPAYRLADGNLK